MSEKLRKILLYSLLAGSAMWGLHSLPDVDRTTSAAHVDTVQLESAPAFPVAGQTSDWVEKKLAEPWGTDPFRAFSRKQTRSAGSGTKSSRPKWILSGILYSRDNPLAYINWKSCKVGDTVDGARVVSIDRKAVTLEKDGSRFTISVNKG